MYEHILLPVDGSEVSLRAADAGIALAAKLGSRVHVLHVVVPLPSVPFLDEIVAASNIQYVDGAQAAGERIVADVCERARAQGVSAASSVEFDAKPHRAIVAVAQREGCDLIVMGCNGWRGLDRLVLGSQTQRVILQSHVPVLIQR